jgi:phospholipid/cholesterol/gamma-HCH transport system substrate-binding protein
MKARASYVLVGLFVLVLGVALIAAVLWLTTGGPPKDYDFYIVYSTESVSGLNIDAEVKYKGVNRGRVREIELDPNDPERVRILLVVQKGTPINSETQATLEYQGLTGIASINLLSGRKEAAPLTIPPGEQYPVIPSKPSLLTRLNETVSELLTSLISLSGRLNTLFDDSNRAALGETFANLAKLTKTLDERANELSTLIANFDAVSRDVKSASAELPEMIAQFKASAVAFERMSDRLAAAGTEVEALGSEARGTLAASGADLAQFTRTTLPEATQLVVELRRAAENLRRASEQLERDPRALIFGPPKAPPGPGEEGGS